MVSISSLSKQLSEAFFHGLEAWGVELYLVAHARRALFSG
jgi:hypothetical protein